MQRKKPNVVYVFSDQHRAEATAYRGNPDVRTPHMERLSGESIDFTTAVAGIPVCCPSRACLITGQHALTHGVFVNDVSLGTRAVSIAEAFKKGGYDTGYIGKWHLDGRGRSNYIPQERRQGFDYWRVLECTHDYNDSHYYGDGPEKLKWEGYDAEGQTRCAIEYIRERRSKDKPFMLMLSWGPPHNPYETAPDEFRALYDPATIRLRPNVPPECASAAREDLAGYYAHISAIDRQLGNVMDALEEAGMKDDTVLVYTSDHGDMLGSHGMERKQKPWDESILVPLLIRYPALFGTAGRKADFPINTPDLMPTLLGMCGLPVPGTAEGKDFTAALLGETEPDPERAAAVIECIHPFGEWHRAAGGREFRGLRTARYTYVCDLNGPWLLYDNAMDPYQLHNGCGKETYRDVQNRLHAMLFDKLRERGDAFLPGEYYIRERGYVTDETGTVPYS